MGIFRKMTAILFSLVIACASHFAHAQDGETILQRCINEGPANVVSGFTAKDWDNIGKQVAFDNEKWLEASVCLYHGLNFSREDASIDYTTGESDLFDYAWATLVDSWAEALLKNPKSILYLGDKISFATVCSYPTQSERRTIEWIDDYLKKATEAINKVEDDGYTKVSKRVCEFYLRLDRERVMRVMIDELRH